MKSILYKISALLGILLFFQIPLFVDQYTLRLEGHVSEANRQVSAYKQSAKDGNKTLDEYIGKFLLSTDADFQREGAVIKAVIARAEFLQLARRSLKESAAFIRPFVFIRYADEQVVKDAWNSFTPGFSCTLEGISWGAFGAVAGVAFLACCKRLLGRFCKQKSEK